jgi:predicted HTH domain antitoxin
MSDAALVALAASATGNPTMTTLTLELPEEVFSALRRSPEELGRELRLAAAIHWYQRGQISQEKAAQVAGLDRTDFLMALAREGVSVRKRKKERCSSQNAYLEPPEEVAPPLGLHSRFNPAVSR